MRKITKLTETDSGNGSASVEFEKSRGRHN